MALNRTAHSDETSNTAAERGAGTEPTPHICKCPGQERVLGAEDGVRAVKEKGKHSELFLYATDSFPRCVSQAACFLFLACLKPASGKEGRDRRLLSQRLCGELSR